MNIKAAFRLTFILILLISSIHAQISTPPDQKSCHECIAEGRYMCKLGGFPFESSTKDFRRSGYNKQKAKKTSICCKDYKNCGNTKKEKAFCSHLA